MKFQLVDARYVIGGRNVLIGLASSIRRGGAATLFHSGLIAGGKT
jgi:hypothetical protein